jgi:hypothetical protein
MNKINSVITEFEEKRYFAGNCILTKENRNEYWITELHEHRSQSEFHTPFHKL